MIGNPLETTIAIERLICAGVLEAVPAAARQIAEENPARLFRFTD